MRIQKFELYVPDIEDNRDKHSRGEPALVISIRPPTAFVWRRFWQAIAEDDRHSQMLKKRREEFGQVAGAVLTMQMAVLDDELAALLWLPCVGKVSIPPGMIEGLDGGDAPTDGAGLWALRTQLDSSGLYQDVLEAIILRSRLEAGLASFLASESGQHPSDQMEKILDGTVASAGIAG